MDAALRDEGFESFAPMRLETRRWSDRTKVVESPLFPGYMFVRMVADPKLLTTVLRLPGLVRFVKVGRELVTMPNAEMETVRALAESDTSCEPAPFPAAGERVRIRGGCLEGVEGVLTGQTDRREIVISVGAIQRSESSARRLSGRAVVLTPLLPSQQTSTIVLARVWLERAMGLR